MDLNDALDLLSRNSGLVSIEKDVISGFAMSKSTISNEFTKRKEYMSLSFVEFLEFIGRISDTRSKPLKPKAKGDENLNYTSSQDQIATDINNLAAPALDPKNLSFDQSRSKLNSSFIQPNLPLVDKIELFLDDLLPIYNQKRKEVKIEIEFDSDLDESDTPE